MTGYYFAKPSIYKYCLLLAFLLIGLLSFAQLDSSTSVEIIITAPNKHKEDTLFIAGNFNGWNPHDNSTMMLPNKQGMYQANLVLKTNQQIEWKVTRGIWAKVEVDLNGSDIPNRINNIKGKFLQTISVKAWKDDFSSKQKQHTASPQVHVMDTAFNLKVLGRKRKVWIYLPKDYLLSHKKYPVLYMHDGQNLFDIFTSGYGEWGLDETLDSIYDATHKSMIVIGIDNLSEKRLQEYNPYDEKGYGKGEGKLYIQSLVQDLKPFVDKHYRTLADAANTTIAGSSMGGIISMWAVMQYPTTFGNAGIFSPAFWIAPQFKSDVTLKMKNNKSKLFFYCGESESKTMESNMDTIINEIKVVSKSLIKIEIAPNGQHNEEAWHSVLPKFLSIIPFK